MAFVRKCFLHISCINIILLNVFFENIKTMLQGKQQINENFEKLCYYCSHH
jgi:hypothetical protein